MWLVWHRSRHFIHSKRTCGWFLLCIINKFLFRNNIFCVNQAVFHTKMTFEFFIWSCYIFELVWYREFMFFFIKPIDSDISIYNKCYRKKQPEKMHYCVTYLKTSQHCCSSFEVNSNLIIDLGWQYARFVSFWD